MSNQYALTYVDETGDLINVSDDEDLFAAYDVAEDSMDSQLKIQVQLRSGDQKKPIINQEVI